MHALGMLLSRSGDFSRAIDMFDRANLIDSSNAAYLYDRGFCWRQMGEHEKANLIYSEMVKLRAAIDGHESVSVSKALLKWSWSFLRVF